MISSRLAWVTINPGSGLGLLRLHTFWIWIAAPRLNGAGSGALFARRFLIFVIKSIILGHNLIYTINC